MSVMLGLLILMGFQPGPQMLTTHLDITMLIIYSLVLANVIATVLLLLLTPQIAKVSFVRANVLVPVVMSILCLVAFASNNTLMDLLMMGFFTLVGWIMKMYQWPRPPLIIALVLGESLEKYMYLSVNTFGWSMFFRPAIIVILVIAVLIVWHSMRINKRVA
jgi:putative tricarboxylic transport membrane protein